MRLTRTIALGFVVTFLAAAVPSSAGAAVIASLSSDHGRPGDLVRFTIPGDYAGFLGRVPLYLIGFDAFDKMVAKYGQQDCSADGHILLGSVTGGTLVFAVPEVPNGQYYLEVEVKSASPSCWRVGNVGQAIGALQFTVGDQAAAPLPAVATTQVSSRVPAGTGRPGQWRLASVPSGYQTTAGGVLFGAVVLTVLGIRLIRRRSRL